jgi:NADH-quinone oxidoreductase subunit N
LNYLEFAVRLAPEIIVTLTALVVMAVDLLVMREQRRADRFWVGTAFAAVGCVGAIFWLLESNLPNVGLAGSLSGMFSDDALARLVKVGLLALAVCALLISVGGKFTDHVGEYLALILFATVGMMLLVSATDLLLIFIALELTSLSLYILTAFNKQNLKSIEAALKYFLFGGMSAAFTLFGLSLVYGVSGSTNLNQIAANLAGGRPMDSLLLLGLVMTVIGLGFKIAAVPFHLWAPDAYEGAPTPSAVLIASGSKLASFTVLARVMVVSFAPASGNGAWEHYAVGWIPLLAILAALSMVVGNLAAIAQSNVKRLLAYSAIAQAGYALLGIIANDRQGLSAVIFYMMTYGLTVAGAFGVVAVVEEISGCASLKDFAGLSRREPLVAACMLVFMLSLAGIPPLAGFIGKFYLFAAVLGAAPNLGLLWLVIVGIALSAVSLYYYLQVLKQIYIAPHPANTHHVPIPLVSKIILAALALAVVLLGCFPNMLLNPLQAAVQASGF